MRYFPALHVKFMDDYVETSGRQVYCVCNQEGCKKGLSS